ncbi:MAG: nucleoside-diphosphate kinase [Candidatus Hinthialibacter antarcticus]|nr:nucleoside-diphosphate kinase [Candidatus Hinthialibacter antarcticus]
METTLLLIKPDGVQRKFVGEIISRLENRGWDLVGMKLMHVTPELAKEHYGEHKEKPFFGELIDYITEGPIVAMAWRGDQVITAMRTMMGKTNPIEAAPGTIRGDLANNFTRNMVHGSDSPESAKREVALFFSDNELAG